MRRLSFLAILTCLFASMASAQPLPKPAASMDQGGIDVTSAEKLALRFPGNPEMTGEYRIGSDETISVPLLGRIPVSGMTPAQLEEALSKRMEQLSGRAHAVTVEVAAYRPVYVTGFVSRPGSIPWQPGMTVLQAVALSGGLFRPAGPNAGGPAASEAEMAKIRRATDDRKRALAAIARLQAERQGSKEIQVPPALVAIAGQKEAQDLIAAQQSLLMSRRTSVENQMASLQRGMALAKQELDGLQEQSKRIDAQLRLRRDARQKLSELQDRGVVLAQRTFEEDMKVSELEEKTAATAVAVARVQATVAALERDSVVLTEERKANIDTEIDRLQKEASQLEDEITTARQSYNLIAGATLDAEEGDRTEINYAVVRQEETGETRVEANQSTLLKPGDALVVSQQMKKKA